MATGKRLGQMSRQYKVVYYNADSTGLALCDRIPWFKNVYTLKDARQTKKKLENQGFINVDILVYDTAIYKVK